MSSGLGITKKKEKKKKKKTRKQEIDKKKKRNGLGSEVGSSKKNGRSKEK
jgi:hypothetical protein